MSTPSSSTANDPTARPDSPHPVATAQPTIADPDPDPDPDPTASMSLNRVVSAVIAIALITTMATIGTSYGRALAYPGQDSVAVRTVDWIRDHGGGPVIDRVENWWFSTHQDPTAGTLEAGPPATNAPPPLGPLGPNSVAGDGEGVWDGLPTDPGAEHVGFATFLRPDPEHPDVRVGVAMFDQRKVRAQLVPGINEPIRNAGPDLGQVPAVIRPGLVATFNSGYKVIDSNGGYYADHQELRPLRKGAASAVIDDAGTVSVVQWGRDIALGPHVTSVRQNLELIVDGGRPVPGLEANRLNRWGSEGSQRQFTWRSAMGTDSAGNLYYVAGDQLTLPLLARALAATGAVRGMALDIHPNMVHLFTYRHGGPSGDLTPSKLLNTMRGPATRYLMPDRRDFFALTHR